ncbi:MAG: hypothetical protein IKM43_02195 [Clostridia bacterium]|nr:hypothetical protein [Clostridia bacterium]
MQNQITNLSINLINNKVNVLLSTLGMNERYNAFEYLSFIITYMIKQDNESTETYNQAIAILQEKYAITNRAITCGLNKLIKMCNNEDIFSKAQFNLNKKSTLNKIRVLKAYILANF